VSQQYIDGVLPAAAADCRTNSSNTAAFRLATEMRYGIRTVAQRGPYAGGFMAVETIPPDVNVSGGTTPNVKLTGPAGEELGVIDGDGNYTWIERDALGREVLSWRESASRAEATPRPISSIQYNRAGQVTQVTEGNALGAKDRTSRYDEAGRLVYVTTDLATGEGIEYVFAQGDLGRVSEIREVTYPSGTALVKVVAQNRYDLPYSAADLGYSYVAGKLSWTTNSETTIAYGYDDAGRVWRRDQWFPKLDATKRFTVSSTYGADGRVLESRVVNPYDATRVYRYEVDYDSAGRPVWLSGNYRNPTTDAALTTLSRVYEAVSLDAVTGARVRT
jgi:hypothetical protein